MGLKIDNQQVPVYPHANNQNTYNQNTNYQEQAPKKATEFEPEQLDEENVATTTETIKRRHPKFVDRFIKKNN